MRRTARTVTSSLGDFDLGRRALSHRSTLVEVIWRNPAPPADTRTQLHVLVKGSPEAIKPLLAEGSAPPWCAEIISKPRRDHK
jgi:hypothetical protein